MRFVSLGDLAFLPSGWLGRGLLAIERGHWFQFGLWSGALWSTALMGLVICDWLAGPCYYRGWCAARGAGSTRPGRPARLYGWVDRLLAPLPAGVRAIVVKDIATFWRDPAQWSQIMILLGLMLIWAPLRSMTRLNMLTGGLPFFESLVSLLNIGAMAFILSILTTRSVYPMLSLEGRQQWIIGLAPLTRARLIWVKYALACTGSLALTVPLVIASCLMLRTDATLTALALLTIVSVALGLNALAIGLGAWMPNFEEDNPSRIANGLGGTLNVVASMIYIGLLLTLETPWVYVHLNGLPGEGSLVRLLWLASIPLWILVQLVVIAVPLAMGLHHWRRIEF
jgi:ABC-2 type transport system permease protein